MGVAKSRTRLSDFHFHCISSKRNTCANTHTHHPRWPLEASLASHKLLTSHCECLYYILLKGEKDSWPPEEEEFNLGPETRLDCSELLCNKVLLKYNEIYKASDIGIRSGQKEYPPASLQLDVS